MWTKEEIEKLIELYPNNHNINIGITLNKTKKSVDNKGCYLGLKKTKELLSKVSSMGNECRIANGGRNLTYETLNKIASKYKTKIDFIKYDGPAYRSATLKGYLNDICKHMTVMKFSIPQLILRDIMDGLFGVEGSYNNRTVIKPYEIDIYYEDFNLGFEYQGIAWHLNNKNDIIKANIIKNKGINLIYIHEYKGSRNYESDIKKQLIGNIIFINKITNKNITKEQILNHKVKNIYLGLYNRDELIGIALTYESFDEFIVNEKIVYRKLCKMKLIDECTKHMLDKKIGKHNFSNEYILSIINKYSNLTDFRRENIVLYQHIKRVGKEFLIKDLKRKKTFILEEIKHTMSNYNTKSDFIINHPKMYKFIRRGELKYLLNTYKQ